MEVRFKPYVAKVVEGDLDIVGSEVCIKNECFYTISSDDDSITMLSKYALYIGNECLKSTASSCTPYGEEATGLQDLTMIGHSATPRKGVIAYSSDEIHGEKYSSYVGSIAEMYVLEYKSYLEGLNIKINDARIIIVEELEKLGCSSSEGTCDNAFQWVYFPPHWTATAYDDTYIWRLASGGSLLTRVYSLNSSQGVRPVITILKNIIG